MGMKLCRSSALLPWKSPFLWRLSIFETRKWRYLWYITPERNWSFQDIIYSTTISLFWEHSQNAHSADGLVGIQVLQSVLPIKDEEVVLGQYQGYKDDPTVPDNSNTPTFATVVLHIHNERWEGSHFIAVSLYLCIFLCSFSPWGRKVSKSR